MSGTAALTDQLGNVVYSKRIRVEDSHFEFKFPDGLDVCPAGECQYHAFLVMGRNDQSCHADWSARAILTDAMCPDKVENWNPDNPVVVRPKVKGCEDSKCKARIKWGNVILDSNLTYNGQADFIFKDINPAGTRIYAFELVNPDNKTTTCNFVVNYNNDKLNTWCSFGSTRGFTWGQTVPLSIQSNCDSCEYKVFYPSGTQVLNGQGIMPSNGSSKSVDVKLLESGQYKVSVNSVETQCGELLLPTLEITGACKVNPNNLTASENATFTAAVDACQSTDDCEWDYVLKKDGSNHKTGKTGKSVSIPVTGYGTYELFLSRPSILKEHTPASARSPILSSRL